MWNRSAIGLLFFAAASAHAAPVHPSPDERAVRALIGRFADSAQDETAAARSAMFADDGQIINAFGNRAEGRREIDAFWGKIFSSAMFRQTTNTEKDLRIRFLTPRLALVDRFYTFSGQRTPTSHRELPPRDIHSTFLLRKDGKQWLVVYFSVADLRSLERERAVPQP